MMMKSGGNTDSDILQQIEKLVQSSRPGTDSSIQSVSKIETDHESPKFKIFKEVILDDKKLFLELYNQLKSEEPNDNLRFDELLSTYFDEDFHQYIWSYSIKLPERILDAIDRYKTSRDTKKIALKLSIILQFMELKRQALRLFFNAMDLDSNGRKKLLAHEEMAGIISDVERKEFMDDPSPLTIERLLKKRQNVQLEKMK